MRLDRFITLNVVRPWRSLFARNSAPDSEGAVPVLMYHSISNDPETGISGYYRVNTTPAAFRDQMAFLSENGYRTLTVSQLVTALQSGKKPEVGGLRTEDRSQPSAFLVITFDDGFHNFYTDAFPVLNEFGFSATMFLPTAFIGETRRPFVPQSGTSASPKQCLTWSEVQECHQAGIEFGSHTVNHPTLVELSWLEIKSEVQDSKKEIEDHLGQPSPSFCYPYAFPQQDRQFVERFTDLLQGSGYSSCATTQIGRVQLQPSGPKPSLSDSALSAFSLQPSAFLLKRLPVNSLDDRPLLKAKMNGHYDWLATPQSMIKRLKATKQKKSHNPMVP